MSEQLETSKINEVCLRTLHLKEPHTIASYESIGGYSMWRKIITEKLDRQTILAQIKQSLLRGRGGAGFVAGVKMGFIPDTAPHPRYLVCNSDEGEPGTCKDTLILQYNPHQLIEGILIACYVQGIDVCYHYIRGEYKLQFDCCEQALEDASRLGLVGKNILGSGVSIDMYNLLGAGSYIVGEETAMLESIEGKPAKPRSKPPFPAQFGLYGTPTTVNNTETLASIPVILEKGAKWFLEYGCENSGGSKIFCVSGHVKKPGVFELPLGTPFKSLLKLCGGMRTGAKLKAVIPGGSSMKVLPASIINKLNMDYDSLQHHGSALGSGGVIVMDDNTCMVKTLLCISKFYQHESCGQCTPCREGTGWIVRTIKRIVEGEATLKDLSLLVDVARQVEGRTICAFGESFSWPVQSFIHHFYDEFEYFIRHRKSKFSGGFYV